MVVNNSSRMEIANRIRELRDSARETAAHLGIQPQEYESYESGAQDVPISVLYGIAGFFGVDLTDRRCYQVLRLPHRTF